MAYRDAAAGRAADRERFRRRTVARVAQGLCPRCGDRPPAPERSVCAPCADKRNRASRARDARLRAEGKPRRDPDKARTSERKRSRREKARRVAESICTRCGKADPRSPGASRRRPGSGGPGAARRSPEASGRPEAPPAPPSPSAPLKTCVVCCSSAFLRQAVEYTLATCPIFRGPLTACPEPAVRRSSPPQSSWSGATPPRSMHRTTIRGSPQRPRRRSSAA